MKIEAGLITTLTTGGQANTSGKESFLAWLDSSLSGDDYYSQHQTQLQQSDLHFRPRSERETLTPCVVEERPVDAEVEATEEQSAVEQPANNAKTSEHPWRLSNQPLPIPDLEELIQQLKTTGKQAIAIEQAQMRIQNNNTKTVQALSKQATSGSEVLHQSHHLFVNGNEAELSLNTADMSKNETRDLKKMIKQWLKDKGFSLSRLMINGVAE